MIMPSGVKIYLATQAIDMRKSHDGLSQLVQSQLKQDVFLGNLFVFFNRGANRVKLFYWDRNGYCYWYKRLEKGCFKRPQMKGATYQVNVGELSLLLEGVDLTTKRLQAL